jgi:peptide/nickel transport system permease protein
VLTYLLWRLAQSLAFIFAATFVVYTALVILSPGGPRARYERGSDNAYFQARLNILGEHFELDKPWPLNYLAWLFDPEDTTELDRNLPASKGIDLSLGPLHVTGSGILTGDFGRSEWIVQGVRSSELFEGRWLNSFLLLGFAFPLSLAFALPIGIVSALRKGSRLDHLLTFASFAGFSLPSYVLGLLLIIFLAILPKLWHDQSGWDWLPHLPAGDAVSSSQEKGDWADRLYHLVLPGLTLALPQAVWMSRHVRAVMIEVLKQDYIRTAWAKGLSTRRVILKHALRNTLIPIITLLGVALPGLASAAVVVERVFGYPGIGEIYFQALGGCVLPQSVQWFCPPLGFGLDHPLALGITVVLLSLVTLSNMLADILYTVADPRISYSNLR